jgi:hypothetical protein
MRRLLPPGYTTFAFDNNLGLGEVSPRRAVIRSEAARAQEKQARIMKRDAETAMGRSITVGSIVQIKIPSVDRCKLDAPYLTTVVIEVC